ncbi:MAG: nucleotide exchange factor GrpE [Deltaproteobacteria bacterium]|nr:nucleotide exchange factor GrpE [Deltaproteobacteria bacterium]
MSEPKESAADRAIREALESVERIERTSRGDAAPMGAEAAAEAVDFVDDPVEAPAEPPKKKSASDLMLESVLKAKGELAEVLAQTQKEAKDMYDRLARVSADFDNFKKRQTKEKSDAIKFANEGVIKEILPVLDNLQRALGAAGTDGGALLDGVKLVAKQMEDVLGKFGVVGFDAAGRTFDPARHEAVGSRPDPEVPAQHVCEEFQRGYMLHDRLLRPALVVVSMGPQAASAAEN